MINHPIKLLVFIGLKKCALSKIAGIITSMSDAWSSAWRLWIVEKLTDLPLQVF